MAAMVMVRVMGGEDDGERKEGDEEKAVSLLPIAYTYLPRYLNQEHETCLLCQMSVFVTV